MRLAYAYPAALTPALPLAGTAGGTKATHGLIKEGKSYAVVELELANGGDPDEKETCALHGQVNVYESQNKSALQHGHRTRQHGHWRRGTRRFRWHRLCV